MKSVFCPECEERAEAKAVEKEEVFNVKGEKITVTSRVLVCEKCHNEIFDEELDDANLHAAYSAYRAHHKLLPPARIRDIREKYGLSQRALGRLLEWGEITVNRYESGGIQDTAHNEVLELIEDPKNMKVLFEKNMNVLPPSTREALSNKIELLINESSTERFFIELVDWLSNQPVDEFSGYRTFSFEKTSQMIVYLAESLRGVYKTAINKYLWYMDFLCFKENAASISGSNYIHLPYGPVPNNYELILGLLVPHELEKEEIEFTNDVVGEMYKAKIKASLSNFSKDEVAVMDYVINCFRGLTTASLSRRSHEEKAYKATREGQKISYTLAKELSLNLPD